MAYCHANGVLHVESIEGVFGAPAHVDVPNFGMKRQVCLRKPF